MTALDPLMVRSLVECRTEMCERMTMRADDLLGCLRRRATKLDIDHRERQGAGSHLNVWHGAGRTAVPMHRGDLPKGTFKAILKQLGLTEEDLEF